MAKTVEVARLRAFGLEPLTAYRAAQGPYEKWLGEVGVPVVWVEALPEVRRDPSGLHSFDLDDRARAWVPAWVNALGKVNRGQALVDAIHAALHLDSSPDAALCAAYALGGDAAVDAILECQETALLVRPGAK